MMTPFFPKRGLVKVRTFTLDGTQDAPPCGLASSRLSELEPLWKLFPATFAPRCGENELKIYFSSNTEEKLGVLCENCNLKGYFESRELVSVK